MAAIPHVSQFEDVSFSSATSDLATYTSTGVESFPSWEHIIPIGVGGFQDQRCSANAYNIYRWDLFRYYVVHQTPVAPMQEPWVGVLEKSCTWANGETTVSGIASEIADNLYSSGFNYEHIGGRRNWSASEFYLSYFLSDYGTGLMPTVLIWLRQSFVSVMQWAVAFLSGHMVDLMEPETRWITP